MIEITRIREDKDALIEGLKKRNFDARPIVDEILSIDAEWRAKKAKMEEILAESNRLAKEIGTLFQQGKTAEANEVKLQTAELKNSEQRLKSEVEALEISLKEKLYTLPNVPIGLVPEGRSAEDNVCVEEHGSSNVAADAIPHWDLAKKYDLIDFELGVKVTGAGFPFYKGKGAKLQRALIHFFLEEATHAGYTEYIPPHMVNEDSAYGTGQLPDKEGQMYHAQVDDFYLIPTAEVPLTNIYRDVVLPSEEYSIKLTGYTPCFRREAGSYGKDVRGLNRLHQFDKVEIVRIEHPDKSDAALEEMIKHVKGLLEKLGLHYRILRLCGGDMGFTSAITYDFEVYSAAQKKWLEVSSVSNFQTFQANRLKLRYKTNDKKTRLCHTLNGSALALPRILAALLENNQSDKGIRIPEVLVPFTRFEWID